jgi:site-specific recombinase XerD
MPSEEQLVAVVMPTLTTPPTSYSLINQHKNTTNPIPNNSPMSMAVASLIHWHWVVREAIQEYLSVRPPVQSGRLFIGERGPLTDIGVRALCKKYSAICGFKIYPHLLRHTMAHQFLKDTDNDIVALAQVLGHQNLNTTSRYTQRKFDQLSEAAERLSY